MAMTATLVKADQNKQTYLLTGDGLVLTVSIPNATILANATGGSVRNAFNQTYASVAAMRAVIGDGDVKLTIRPRSTTWTAGVDVATDGTTPTKPQVVVTAAVAPANLATAYLDVEFQHSANSGSV